MLQFEVFDNGVPATNIDLTGAYVFGEEQVPLRADLAADGNRVSCIKRVPGACGLCLLREAGAAGRLLLATTRLPERAKPYHLNIELARAQLTRLGHKVEEWGLFDFPEAEPLMREYEALRRLFVEALQRPTPGDSARSADRVLDVGVTLGEKMALFHAEILLDRRKSSSGRAAAFGCVVDLLSQTESYRERLRETFDFLSIPLPWKQTEPQERVHQYTQVDAYVNYAARIRRPVHLGPLLSFDPRNLPEWLYLWEHDYESLRDLIYEHIQRIVQRYERQVRVWNVVSGLHSHNSFDLSFDQLMELTRMSCLLTKKLVPQATVLIELDMPWGEYYARNQRTIPPFLYADMAVQSGIKFDAFGVQIYMGVPADGFHVRDLLQVSSLLDEFSHLGKPVHVTAVGVPSDVTPDAWDAWGGKAPVEQGGQWHAPWSPRLQAEWLQAFYRIALSKPFIESVCWRDLADYEGHVIPHGGLCRNDLEPKLAYKELRNFRASLLSSAKAGGGQGRS